MEDYWQGIHHFGLEIRNLNDYDRQFGLNELAAKVLDKTGTQYTPGNEPISLDLPAGRCDEPHAAEIVGKYLDSSILSKQLEDFHKGSHCWDLEEATPYRVLVTAAMTFGCHLPAGTTHSLWKLPTPQYQALLASQDPSYAMIEKARLRFEAAMSNYQKGTPHDFGQARLWDLVGEICDNLSEEKRKELAGMSAQELHATENPFSHLALPIEHNFDSKHRGSISMSRRLHPYAVCAGCGKSARGGDGKAELLKCGKYKERRYCSKKCQKAHWKTHKPICTLPKAQLGAFLNSIPLYFDEDVDEWGKKAKDGACDGDEEDDGLE